MIYKCVLNKRWKGQKERRKEGRGSEENKKEGWKKNCGIWKVFENLKE